MSSLISSGVALRAVPTRLVVVAGLHLVVIWALISGLQMHAQRNPPPVSIGKVIEDHHPTPTDTVTQQPPTLPTITEVPKIPPVVETIQDPGSAQIVDVDATLTLPMGPGAVTSIPTPAPVVTGAAVDPRHPLTQPPYPPGAIRGNEEGALNLSILVGTDGRVRDAKVAESSGSTRLDQAAMSEARAHWRLRPATRGGIPFEQWLTLRVVFRLENR